MSLKLENVSIGHGRKALFSGITLEFLPGHVYGLLAPNGSGKTTFLRAISGDERTHLAGRISIDDAQIYSLKYQRRLYFANTDPSCLIMDLRLKSQLELVKDAWKSAVSAEEIVSCLEIEELLDKKARRMSQGERQLGSIALALVNGADFILLDEPMNALDPIKTERAKEAILTAKTRGACILLSSHLLESLDEMADEFVLFPKSGPHIQKALYESRELFRNGAPKHFSTFV